MSIRSRQQSMFEAKQRQKEIKAKTKKLGITECGNVKSSFGRNNKEFLLNMGFYEKNTKHNPTKSAWVEKRLNPEVTEIQIRKQGE